MPKFFVSTNKIDGDKVYIEGQDFNHIVNVLRLRQGDKINIGNADTGENYICEIANIEEKAATAKVIEKVYNKSESNIEVHIMQGLPKADKMELIIQKSTELGVCKIIPVKMDRCIVKLSEKDEEKKILRWNKIAEAAAKQCGRDIIPKVTNIINVKDIISMKQEYDKIIVAYENEDKQSLKSVLNRIKNTKEKLKVAILIGPEGGISEDEIKLLNQIDADIVTIGKRILRTETVALAISSMIIYEFEL